MSCHGMSNPSRLRTEQRRPGQSGISANAMASRIARSDACCGSSESSLQRPSCFITSNDQRDGEIDLRSQCLEIGLKVVVHTKLGRKFASGAKRAESRELPPNAPFRCGSGGLTRGPRTGQNEEPVRHREKHAPPAFGDSFYCVPMGYTFSCSYRSKVTGVLLPRCPSRPDL